MREKDTLSDHLLQWENTPIEALKLAGLGPQSKAKLARAGCFIVRDLIFLLPRKYHDYAHVVSINAAPTHEEVHIRGSVLRAHTGKTYQQRIDFLEILLDDGSGTLRVIWFHQAYLNRQIKAGVQLAVFGKIGFDRTGRHMTNPRFRVLDGEQRQWEGIEPVYRQLGGLRSAQIGNWIGELLQMMPEGENLPARLLHELALPRRKEALFTLHRPSDSKTVAEIKEGRAPAWNRLVFEEFFYFHWGLIGLSQTPRRKTSPRVSPDTDAVQAFEKLLPFQLTGDQRNVMTQLITQLRSNTRLFNLVQGDVGCGKTIIGLFAAWLFARAGWQTALLCPTTVLAGQHGETAQQVLGQGGLKVGVLTSAMPAAQQTQEQAAVASGETDLLIGTHKIFQDDVSFKNLGLVLVDEQHRFGVNQRSALLAKGSAPHYLTFSATPIPRSLAMAVFAGYDIQQIREKPAGRKEIRTILKKSENRHQIISFVRRRIRAGERVFWIFPLIEGEEDQQEKSAAAMFETLRREFLPEISVSLVHGRLGGSEIQTEMAKFKAGITQVMVATSVVEVGVDVGAATIMVVESAQNFGLSQLHQLRGRVGRSDRSAFCFLVVDQEVSRDGLKRLRFLESCQDGFRIAEFDLKQRGFGELLGKRQSGFNMFRFGDPVRHRKWFDLAQSAARRTYENDERMRLNLWGRECWWRASQD